VSRRDEPVRMGRIYTRAGDGGVTSLGDGARVSKSDLRIEAYGSVDELNAAVGFVIAAGPPDEICGWLVRIQNDLFDLGADLAVPLEDTKRERLRAQVTQVGWLEQLCDLANAGLKPLRSFVLPGGGELGARLHLARAICRRAERRAADLANHVELNPNVLGYLNRLGDLLFILARAANSEAAETLWKPGLSLRPNAPEATPTDGATTRNP
jgi:cob(I)alamin adenosyltransferase